MSFLNEIRKNAGELEQTTNESISSKSNNLKSKIIKNTSLDYVVEMAQQHFDNEILDLILQGKHAEAADRYIQNQSVAGYRVPPKADATVNKIIAGAFAKGFKGSKEKVQQITKNDWDKFKEEYKGITSSEMKPRERVKKKGSLDPSGKTVTSVSARANAKKLRSKVTKLRDEAIARMNAAETQEEIDDHENHAEALNTMLKSIEYTLAGKPVLAADTPEKLEKIKQRYKKIGKKYEVPAAVAPPEDEDDEDYVEPIATDAEREKAYRNLRQRKHDRYRWDVEESLNLKGKILAESFEYSGQNFWKNYTMTTLMKAFAKDYKILGEETKYIYAKIFGVGAAPIFEYLEDNSQVLNEVVKIKSPLLFEDYGYNALMEMETAGPSGSVLAKKNFLAGLWDKVKKFGGPIVGKLAGLLSSGVSWAKNIAQQGLGWIASNPIAQVAIPAVVLAGSAIGAVKLINRMRRKKGERKLSKQEQQEIKRLSLEKSDEIEKQSKKMGGKPPVRSAEPRDEMDDEEDLVSDEER